VTVFELLLPAFVASLILTGSGHLVGGGGRRAAGLLLPHRALGDGDVVLRWPGTPPRDRLDHAGATIVAAFGLTLLVVATARFVVRRLVSTGQVVARNVTSLAP
jgi:hypothetical protein